MERYIAKSTVDCIFRTVEQTGRREFLVIATARKLRHSIKHRRRLFRLTCCDIVSGHGLIFAIGGIGRNRRNGSATAPARRTTLTKIGKGYDIASIGGSPRLVGHPHLHSCNLDACSEIGQLLHGGIIVFTKILGKEEVTILFIICHIDFKRHQLYASL